MRRLGNPRITHERRPVVSIKESLCLFLAGVGAKHIRSATRTLQSVYRSSQFESKQLRCEPEAVIRRLSTGLRPCIKDWADCISRESFRCMRSGSQLFKNYSSHDDASTECDDESKRQYSPDSGKAILYNWTRTVPKALACNRDTVCGGGVAPDGQCDRLVLPRLPSVKARE